MDDEIKIKLSQLLNPYSILPNFRPRSFSNEPSQQESSDDEINQSDASEKAYSDDEEYTEEPPSKKKKLDGPSKCFDLQDNSSKSQGESSHQSPQQDISNDDISQSDASEEIFSDHTPGESDEYTIRPPPKRKIWKKMKLNSKKSSDRLKNCSPYKGMTSRELNRRIIGDKVIGFCQELGLVASEVFCKCGLKMRLRSKSGHDGCRWICYGKKHDGRPNQTIRKGTWFEGSKLSIGDILWLAYMWVHEYSIISMMHECDHSNSTVIGWATGCLDLCRDIVALDKNPIGGQDVTVEIFSCAITENKEPTGEWAFCAIEESGTNFLYQKIDDSILFSLLQTFDLYILPGTKVVANNWSILSTLEKENFNSLTKEKSISFLDLVTKKEINSFEMLKNLVDRPTKLDEWSKLEFGSNLFEKMYRKRLKQAPDAFVTFLKDVAKVYKPCEKYITISTETTQ